MNLTQLSHTKFAMILNRRFFYRKNILSCSQSACQSQIFAVAWFEREWRQMQFLASLYEVLSNTRPLLRHYWKYCNQINCVWLVTSGTNCVVTVNGCGRYDIQRVTITYIKYKHKIFKITSNYDVTKTLSQSVKTCFYLILSLLFSAKSGTNLPHLVISLPIP